MIWENLSERDRNRLQEIVIGDAKLEEIDAQFYDLLDAVDDTLKEKLEDAYIEYGVRAVQLAYIQGVKDCKNKTNCAKENADKITEELE